MLTTNPPVSNKLLTTLEQLHQLTTYADPFAYAWEFSLLCIGASSSEVKS